MRYADILPSSVNQCVMIGTLRFLTCRAQPKSSVDHDELSIRSYFSLREDKEQSIAKPASGAPSNTTTTSKQQGHRTGLDVQTGGLPRGHSVVANSTEARAAPRRLHSAGGTGSASTRVAAASKKQLSSWNRK